MSVIQKTWPYGTKRRGTVQSIDYYEQQLRCRPIQLILDDQNEGHVLVGAVACDTTAKAGYVGTLVFTEGGPTGGFWKFTADNPQPVTPAVPV